MSALSAELEMVNELLRRPTAANLDRVAYHLEALAGHLRVVIGDRTQTEACTTAFGNWLKSQTAAVNQVAFECVEVLSGDGGGTGCPFWRVRSGRSNPSYGNPHPSLSQLVGRMSLFANLSSTANTLRAFQQALTVTQNNVANASTPGYASQRQTLSAEPFDPSTGLVGGVTAGEIQSSRDQFAESYVRNSNSQWGASDQKTQSLSYLQTNFDISGTSGITGALTSLYNAFSNWSVTPNDATARQNVIANAQSTADAFRQTAANVAAFSRNTDAEIGSTVDQANALVDKLRQLNVTIKNGAANDPSVDASVNSTLESLSEMMNVTALRTK